MAEVAALSLQQRENHSEDETEHQEGRQIRQEVKPVLKDKIRQGEEVLQIVSYQTVESQYHHNDDQQDTGCKNRDDAEEPPQ